MFFFKGNLPQDDPGSILLNYKTLELLLKCLLQKHTVVRLQKRMCSDSLEVERINFFVQYFTS